MIIRGLLSTFITALMVPVLIAQTADLKMPLSKYGLPVVKGTKVYQKLVLVD
ncbi:MAG: hypothetical protein HKN76_20230, partial [Saprospiraceae bacterium]|nr:hypothetical protein [Saprospiraceae bacterium]